MSLVFPVVNSEALLSPEEALHRSFRVRMLVRNQPDLVALVVSRSSVPRNALDVVPESSPPLVV